MLLVPIILFFSAAEAATTLGPLAPISIRSLQAWSTARPCAANCLAYNGVWACGVNAGYHDLGNDLGCGCSPTNGCWCSSGLQSSATSYISSCVSAGCSKLGSLDGDIKSMLDLYGGYCATANVEVSSAPAQTIVSTTPPAQTLSSKATTKGTGATSPTAAGDTSGYATAPAEKGEDEGLSKSDIIAMATGLGVGIPSLIIGALALWFQLRRRRTAEKPHIALIATPGGSQTHFIPPRPNPTPSPPPRPPFSAPPNTYELGDYRGQRQ
jgi:hypothetical protein